MALRLPKFQAGRPILEELTAEKLNQMVDAIRQCEISSGVGYDVTRGPGGTSLAIRQDKGSSTSKIGAAYVVGPPVTGIGNDGLPIAPGLPTPAWSIRRPNSDVFEPIYVFGQYNHFLEEIAVSCSSLSFEYVRYDSGVTISESDKVRFVGLMADYQGQIHDYWNSNGNKEFCPCDPRSPNYNEDDPVDCSVPGNSTCNYISNNGTQQDINQKWNPGQSYSAAGAFGYLADTCYSETGNTAPHVFRCTFDLGSINPSMVKLRFRLRPFDGLVTAIQLNSAAALYTPSGTFSTNAGFNETREISEGFIDGINTFDIYSNASYNGYHPGIACQFEPTTALIVSKTGDGADAIGGLSDLTEAQQDLIGLGTPVKALNGNDPYIWSYKGTGSKTSSSSYNELRPA